MKVASEVMASTVTMVMSVVPQMQESLRWEESQVE
jgi:hypothetical protein